MSDTAQQVMPQTARFVKVDSGASLEYVLQQMIQEGARYAFANTGYKCFAYSNDAIAKAFETNIATLREVAPSKQWHVPVVGFLDWVQQRSPIREPDIVLEMRLPIVICSNKHSAPSPPAHLGGTCRCGATFVVSV